MAYVAAAVAITMALALFFIAGALGGLLWIAVAAALLYLMRTSTVSRR
jgi:hypothetical protein